MFDFVFFLECVGSGFALFCSEKFFEFFVSDVFTTFSLGLCFHSFVDVVCYAGVEGAVLTFEDIYEPRFFHYSFRFFCFAQDEQTRAVSLRDM